MAKILKWIVIAPVAAIAFVMLVGTFSKPKNDPKSLLEKAAKDCFVEKAQNRMSDAPCRAMENSARNL